MILADSELEKKKKKKKDMASLDIINIYLSIKISMECKLDGLKMTRQKHGVLSCLEKMKEVRNW